MNNVEKMQRINRCYVRHRIDGLTHQQAVQDISEGLGLSIDTVVWIVKPSSEKLGWLHMPGTRIEEEVHPA